MGGGDENVFFVPLLGWTSLHETELALFDSSSPWINLMTPKIRPTTTSAMTTLRTVRHRFRRSSALRIASRRISRLMRCRSRLVALGTAAQSRGGSRRYKDAGNRVESRSRPPVRSGVLGLVVQKFGGTSV